ncbi:MAG: dihydroorotate dehydrogenase electron transfer subunit [Tannerella sp.]|nr:dihydroorotate dehydrogenase electron transfer subunit [Tannerella sp.]
MKKYTADMKVVENKRLHDRYCLLRLTSGSRLPEMVPGQFVEARVENTFLRRPISVNYLDRKANELWLLIRIAGEGTRRLSEYEAGETVNLILPLGNGFTAPQKVVDAKPLLVGGGVGVAPLLYLGDVLKSIGFEPVFLLGARTKDDILQLGHFEKIGKTFVTTEDGSSGEKGFVTDHSVLRAARFDRIYTCGPKPMMVAVAKYARATDTPCEVSLENMMACGIGACLCCVEKTVKGNVCVCTDGPVFNINQLTWQI